VNRDGPAKVVSERLGHATIAITLDVYGHVIPGMDTQAAVTTSRANDIAPPPHRGVHHVPRHLCPMSCNQTLPQAPETGVNGRIADGRLAAGVAAAHLTRMPPMASPHP
jgi:hypothetical protein